MSWNEFLKFSNTPKRYHNPTKDTPLADKDAYRRIDYWLSMNPARSLVLTGDPGRGKTYAMYYIIKNLLEKYHISFTRFARALDIDQKILADIKEWGSASHYIQCLCEVEFLFIDDFGMESGTERMERNYYDLLDRRVSNEVPTILSTNLKPEEFEKNFGGRIASRLQEFMKISFKGQDLRRPDVKSNLET